MNITEEKALEIVKEYKLVNNNIMRCKRTFGKANEPFGYVLTFVIHDDVREKQCNRSISIYMGKEKSMLVDTFGIKKNITKQVNEFLAEQQ